MAESNSDPSGSSGILQPIVSATGTSGTMNCSSTTSQEMTNGREVDNNAAETFAPEERVRPKIRSRPPAVPGDQPYARKSPRATQRPQSASSMSGRDSDVSLGNESEQLNTTALAIPRGKAWSEHNPGPGTVQVRAPPGFMKGLPHRCRAGAPPPC